MPRLLTLFFDFGSDLRASNRGPTHAEQAAHRQVVSIMRGLVRAVPPFKWLLVLPQLTSRVCHPQPDVAELVTSLLVRVGCVCAGVGGVGLGEVGWVRYVLWFGVVWVGG